MRNISAAELVEWQAFYNLEPFGDLRDDLRAGIIVSTLYNLFRGKRATAKNAKHFMPYLKQDQQLLDPKGKGLSRKIRGVLGNLGKRKKRKW